MCFLKDDPDNSDSGDPPRLARQNPRRSHRRDRRPSLHRSPTPPDVELQPLSSQAQLRQNGDRSALATSLNQWDYMVQPPPRNPYGAPGSSGSFYEVLYRHSIVTRLRVLKKSTELVVEYINLRQDPRPPGTRPYASQLLLAFWNDTLYLRGDRLRRLRFAEVTEPSAREIRKPVYHMMNGGSVKHPLHVNNWSQDPREQDAFEMVEKSKLGKIATYMLDAIREQEGGEIAVVRFEFDPTGKVKFDLGIVFGHRPIQPDGNEIEASVASSSRG
ncbi:hypothetical protein M406DRAFT_332368 [Cryphonectria parasitica EP155]|uniref:Uncharacterized protein n=1 Tax=Cryphonectria parasitica (strain ATCC 38755 / EP155) TaxID=660469 RepID=A0A9P5CNA2_CRYP1|nr:uncharacterized protein M406DRAFT_332368 [Cryphonectria parasitica EP155]KAF3763926.1 hypothetical protein M406DRAFT_332368 [Cryphonectria parasitica EP155]